MGEEASVSHAPSYAQRLCLRQNRISRIELPNSMASTLRELDLYDNLISHLKGLEHLINITSLDLSFNKLKHIKNVNHLRELENIYFVQNKISRIEGLDGLDRIRNLELAANRIRVSAVRGNQRPAELTIIRRSRIWRA